MRLSQSTKYGGWTAYFMVVVVLIGIDALGWLTGLRSLGERLINPTSRGVRTAIYTTLKPVEMVRFIRSGPSRIADLERRYAESLVALEQFEDVQSENASMRKLLGSGASQDYKHIPVRVVAGDTELALSAGKVAGIEAGDVVIDEAGVIVGRVVRVSAWTSWVLTPMHELVETGVVVGPEKVTGLMEGKGGTGIVLVEQGDRVLVDDLVETSGVNGEYPARLIVGRVISVAEESADINKKIMVESMSQPGDLVFVVRKGEE